LIFKNNDKRTMHVNSGHSELISFDQASSDSAVSLVDNAIVAAFNARASDIHFEVARDGLLIKLRIDGILVDLFRLNNLSLAREAISRLKVLASLDITESRIPQDGRFRFEHASLAGDIRASVVPGIHGEDVVLRILDRAPVGGGNEVFGLQALGMSEEAVKRVRALAARPSGLLLVTGPTGSGKTTTLYAAISEINNGREKIITIEDPVEYELGGVLQIPVNDKKGLSFATGLRAILRHDPDRILVGEIRDAETADIAVQSALTGHMVYTTIHANSLADVVGRFRHFSLDVFGLAAALNGVVVQRLVRRLCEKCSELVSSVGHSDPFVTTEADSQVKRAPRRAIGCRHCMGSGYKGRIAVAEVHIISDEFRELIVEGAHISKLRQAADSTAMPDIRAQINLLVQNGFTTAEEAERVLGWQ
jgi:general secretion pathway protein E